MNADRIQIQEGPSRVFQNRKGESTQLMEDNRVQSALQAKMVETMQRDAMDEDDLLQGKFAVQRDVEDEDELLQGKFVAQRQTKNQTGIPDHVIQGMESSFGTDFSSVRVHPDSSKAPEVGGFGIYARYGYPFRPRDNSNRIRLPDSSYWDMS